MTVSVIIPVYNVKPYLERCVQSVLDQTYKDLEIILVDDGSTDGSGEMCDQLANQTHCIRVIHQENQGLSAARNTGIREATGEYIVFLDSDDKWLIDDGLTMLLCEDGAKTDLIVFKNVHIWRNGHQTFTKDYDMDNHTDVHDAQEMFSYLVMTQQFRMSACFLLVRRQLLVDNNVYFPVGIISEDVHWSLHLWQYAHTVTFHNMNFYGYFHRSDSLSTTASIQVYESYDKIFSDWKERCNNGCKNKEFIRSYLADMWVNRGYNYLKLKSHDRPKAIIILRKHTDLLQYGIARKTQRSLWLVKTTGVKGTAVILGTYWYLRSIAVKHVT